MSQTACQINWVSKFWQQNLIVFLLLEQSRCANQIEEVCNQVDKKIEETLQNCLNDLKADVEKCEKVLDERLIADKEARGRNKKRMIRSKCLNMYMQLTQSFVIPEG